MITQHAFEIILWRSLAIFLLIGALTGIAVALVLIYRPALYERVSLAANRWVSTRHYTRAADRMLSLESWFYRHHRLLGILVCVGAGYLLVYFGLLFDKAAALQQLPQMLPIRLKVPLLEGLLDALVLVSLTGAAASLFVGLLLWLRPSLLRGIEEASNQWISTRRAERLLDIPRDEVEAFVACHARRVGWLLLLGSLSLLLLVLRALA
ncbi:MAG: hypothetical protein A2061_07970 [Gallionellales bacterium GWA2_59_43]|nr:MAG: hypothetical protein A2061_07970 [Gallionellales bacterium GWA2_59_43]